MVCKSTRPFREGFLDSLAATKGSSRRSSTTTTASTLRRVIYEGEMVTVPFEGLSPQICAPGNCESPERTSALGPLFSVCCAGCPCLLVYSLSLVRAVQSLTTFARWTAVPQRVDSRCQTPELHMHIAGFKARPAGSEKVPRGSHQGLLDAEVRHYKRFDQTRYTCVGRHHLPHHELLAR